MCRSRTDLPRAVAVTSRPLFLSRHHELRRPQQRSLDLRVWKDADGLARGFGVPGGLFGGVFERTITVQDGEDVGVSDAVESAVVQDGFDLAALGGGAALQRMNDGHRRFAFTQVAGNGLAQHTLLSSEVEHIVLDLEG